MYCIFNKRRGMYCRWNEDIITFDTKKECYDFMNMVPSFFKDEVSDVVLHVIPKKMEEDVGLIKYSELDKSLFLKENDIVEYNKKMKEVLKNG